MELTTIIYLSTLLMFGILAFGIILGFIISRFKRIPHNHYPETFHVHERESHNVYTVHSYPVYDVNERYLQPTEKQIQNKRLSHLRYQSNVLN